MYKPEFKTGSGGRYVWDKETQVLVKTAESVSTLDAGFGGPVWFPKSGTKYFDKALQKTFHSKAEKKAYMKEKHLVMSGDTDKKHRGPEAGMGRTLYFYNK